MRRLRNCKTRLQVYAVAGVYLTFAHRRAIKNVIGKPAGGSFFHPSPFWSVPVMLRVSESCILRHVIAAANIVKCFFKSIKTFSKNQFLRQKLSAAAFLPPGKLQSTTIFSHLFQQKRHPGGGLQCRSYCGVQSTRHTPYKHTNSG